MVSHMTHMSHVEPISFNATMLKSFGEEPIPPETAFIDQRAAPLVKINFQILAFSYQT